MKNRVKDTILASVIDRPIAFNRAYAELSQSIIAGLMLSQGVYWALRAQDDGWFYKTRAEWYEETYMSRKEQETARAILRKLQDDEGNHVWSEDLRGVPAKMYYRVDINALYNILSGSKIPSSWPESDQLVGTNVTNKVARKSPTNTETTTETTTESSLTSNEVKVSQAQPAHTNGAHQKAVGQSGTLVSPSFFDEPTFGEGVKTVNGKGQSGTTNSSARKQKKVADPEKVAQDWLWIERLADILGMDSKINAGRLGKTRNALRSSGYTLDDLDIYAREVWPSSWKAKNEAHPKENDLREGILEARKIRERRTGRVEPAVRADGMFTLADPFGENLVVK